MIRHMLRSLLICLVLLTPAYSTAFCSPVNSGTNTWTVNFLGSFKVADSFEAAEIKDIKKITDKQQEKLDETTKNTTPTPAGKAGNNKWKERMEKAQIAAYQWAINDNDAYHIAFAAAFKDAEIIDPQFAQVFKNELSLEQQLMLTTFQQMLTLYKSKLEYTDPKTNTSIKIVNVTPIAFTDTNNGKIANIGLRLIGKSEGFVLPLYAKLYIMNANNHLAGLMVVSFDTDRDYWDSLSTDLMNNLELAQ